MVQGNARQGSPTLWHQCQLVQDPLPLELNRRLVAKSRHSEVFSAANAAVGPRHLFVISSILTMINTRTIGSVLTLPRHFHLSPLDPLARKREGSAEGATCSVAQSKRDGNRDGTETGTQLVLTAATQRRSRFWVACAWSCCLVRAWSRPCLRELASKMRPSFVIMAWFYARPQCKQGRSHGCTVFGSLGAGISETGTTPRQACRVALRFDASVCHSASLETSQTRRQAARLP